MRKIRTKSVKILSAAALMACAFATPVMAEEVYPGVNIPDEVYKTEYGDKENYSEIKYYKWSTNEAGAKILVEGTAEDCDLKYYVSSQKDTISDVSQVITENQNGGDINVNIIDLTLDSKHNAITNAVNNEIGNINADIVDSTGNSLISTQGTIDNISVNAINNGNKAVHVNNKDIVVSSITGNFIGNDTTNVGAVYVQAGTVDKISGNFIGNRTSVGTNGAAAITLNNLAYTHVGSIEGVFIDNYDINRGGAISNSGIIDSIKGIFINNHGTEGSAIWQYGVVGSIEGYFEGNRGAPAIFAYKRGLLGGAEYNIGSINGIFKNNDGAVCITGQKVNSVTGIFIDNNGVAVEGSWGSPSFNSISGYYKNNKSAINNSSTSTMKYISGTFIENNKSSETQISGGAIYTGGKIGEFDADGKVIGGGISNSTFTGNYVQSESGLARGGTIYNEGKIADILTTTFEGNYAISKTGSAIGGAIYNSGSIRNISADFTGNYAKSEHSGAQGGAIYNTGTIESITGNFIDNSSSSSGGAIFNDGYIGSISGTFINNSASLGSAIYLNGLTDTVEGYFEGNRGGAHAIRTYVNNSVITDERKYNIYSIKGVFIDNDGAIHNTQKLGTISGVFKNNHVMDRGGAILHLSAGAFIDSINNSIFEGNYVSGDEVLGGGAIYFGRTLHKIDNCNFNGNYVYAKTGEALGGAIRDNSPDLTSTEILNSNFVGNYAKSETGGAKGGAIYNIGNIGKITGSFVDNYVSGAGETFGGAIYNTGSITGIEGDFIGNKIESHATLRGTGIYNQGGHIDYIKGNFIENVGTNDGRYQSSGAITNYTKSTIDSVKGNFIRNTINATNFAFGGAIGNFSSSVIKTLEGDFIENGATSTDSRSGGGAIFLGGTSKIENIINSSFIGNYAIGNAETTGGAIRVDGAVDGDIAIIADAGESVIKDNYTQVGEERDDNAIYLARGSVLNFKSLNNGKIEMYDNIRGDAKEVAVTDDEGNAVLDDEGNAVTRTQNYTVNITGDGTGSFGLYNDIYAGDVTIGNTTINTINNDVHTYNFNAFTLTGDTNMTVDVDLAKERMDRFSAKEYGEHQGTLNVSGMNLLSDAEKDTTVIMFAEEGLKDNVTTTVKEVAYSPIYKYDVNYLNKADGGYFVFNRGAAASSGNPSDGFNPSVLSAPVSAVAATQATINETFKYVFEHADTFTQMPSMERHARINANKYALSTEYNENIPYSSLNNTAGWFKPYVTFETMNLKHGPKVDAITYGSLAGFDTDFHEHKNGWMSVGTGYVGYNGSQLNYKGVDTTMNGGLLGYTHTMYKRNFWTALTLSAGASVGESKTMYGKEDFTSLMAGVGSKTGYNFEFKDGKYILQPIMFMSYTFANTFDYTNAAGVKIKPSPAHSIQVNPSVRFIANTKKGWQPYASVGMVWNVMNENKVTANSVRLPEMGMKPYVEYGLGLQRNWKDRFTAYGQAMIRNGGRNGIALTGGFRWALGKGGVEKVHNKELVRSAKNDRTRHCKERSDAAIHSTRRTVLKQLSPVQKAVLTKSQNTTKTTNIGVIKHL
ncbi:MAG: hypothetical protein NC191_01505 [Muribaculaceae bacterium]|nr:hypothetical protein [Muribaculaceae bacterium]